MGQVKKYVNAEACKRLLISSWSVNKHGFHRQFLFLVGWFL